MAGLSNLIEEFIKNLIDEMNGVVEIQRNELANYFDCAPSQINYVLSTRFTPYKGYYIESKRGGGGYIKIVKVDLNENNGFDFEHIINDLIGDSITEAKAIDIIETFYEEGLVSKKEANIIKAAISDRAFGTEIEDRNRLRANILKNIILILVE
ncbi:MAG TPA: CtsR family transcriptional regulator [Soehngenia sp.]|nr:CtsR family transcriptional regulator [Soehngenia sp.]HPP31205.1 CtsR family transcriptional regulator [Soehngenia sp.]